MKNSIVIFGGAGGLGKKILPKFLNNYQTVNIDYIKNPESDENILLTNSQSPKDQINLITKKLSEISKTKKIKSIINVAGGFEMQNINSPEIFESCHRMIKKNFYSSLMAGNLASNFLDKNDLLILTGAEHTFFNLSPEMLSYALSKNLVHNLNINLAKDLKNKEIDVLTILPTVIDTKANRESMADMDKTNWLPPDKIGDLLYMWVNTFNRPETGTFVKLEYNKGSIVTSLH